MQLLSVEQARQRLGLGRTAFYQLLGTGAIRAKKLGRRTFITDDEIGRFVSEMPTYKQRRRKKRPPDENNE
jgi:excisionase family DNA binding protein